MLQFDDIEGQKILILEDDADVALLLKTYFLRKKCTVSIAHTMEDALQIAEAQQPHIAMLSFNMDADFRGAVQQMRKACPNLRVFVDGKEINS